MCQKKFVYDQSNGHKQFVQWSSLGPKMAHPCNSGSALRIFFLIFPEWKGPIGTWKSY